MGYALVALASLLFGTFPSIQELVLAAGVDPIALVAVCNGIAALFSLAVCLARGISLRVSARQLASLALIGAIGLFMTDFLLDVAYTMIPVGFVTMIHFLYPALVCAAGALFFGERMTYGKVLAIVLSLAGLFLLAGGGFSGSFAGVIVAAVTAVAYAFYMSATEHSVASEVDPMGRVFYTNAAVAIIGWAATAATGATLPAGAIQWGQCLVIGIMLCCAIALINMGVEKIGAAASSLINTLEPVASMVVSSLAFHFPVSAAALGGCLLIIASLPVSLLGGPSDDAGDDGGRAQAPEAALGHASAGRR